MAVSTPPTPDLAGGRSPVFSGVIGGEDLDLLDAVHILRAEHGTGRTSSRRHRAVYHHDVFIGSAAVDAKTAVAYAIGIKTSNSTALHAGLQERHRDEPACRLPGAAAPH